MILWLVFVLFIQPYYISSDCSYSRGFLNWTSNLFVPLPLCVFVCGLCVCKWRGTAQLELITFSVEDHKSTFGSTSVPNNPSPFGSRPKKSQGLPSIPQSTILMHTRTHAHIQCTNALILLYSESAQPPSLPPYCCGLLWSYSCVLNPLYSPDYHPTQSHVLLMLLPRLQGEDL